MVRDMSGWEARESTTIEREMDLGGGLVRRAVMVRWIAVGSWLERQRRGMRRLILVSSSWVRFGGGCAEDESVWKRRNPLAFEGKRKRCRHGFSDFIVVCCSLHAVSSFLAGVHCNAR